MRLLAYALVRWCRHTNKEDRSPATDADFEGVQSVIAHEYFHNWSGNRVTCRDWFQLTLKEGLTVFRDQQVRENI
jgi:aminopeptidase N